MTLGTLVTAAAKPIDVVEAKEKSREFREGRGSKLGGFHVCRGRHRRKRWCSGLAPLQSGKDSLLTGAARRYGGTR